MTGKVLVWDYNGAGWSLTHPDVQVDDVRWTHAIQSPMSMEVELGNERVGLPEMLPWRTLLGVEIDGQLRALGIVTDRDSQDQQLTINCLGLSGYPYGMPWTDGAVRRYNADPGELIGLIWDKLQAHRWGDLKVTVDRVTTNVRVGVKTAEVKDADDKVIEQARDEPWVLDRTETHDLGAVIDQLMTEAGLEWCEQVAYRSGSEPGCRVEIDARLGARRHDLRCVIGEGVIVVPAVEEEPTDYASDVLVIGAGEGPARVVAQEWVPTPTRLRRVHVHTAVDLDRHAAAAAEARSVLAAMQPTQGEVSRLSVIDSPGLPVWSIRPGDELRLIGDLGQAGDVDRWVRVIAIESSLSVLHRRELEVVGV